MSAFDALDGPRDAGPPRHHTALGAAGWSRLGGGTEPAAKAAAPPVATAAAPAARVPASGPLPGLVVKGGVCVVEGEAGEEGEPPTAEQMYDHVIGHLDRLDSVLDARAADLESRARALEEMQDDSFREQRRRALAAQEAGLSGAMGRVADQTRRATEQLSAVMADGISSVIVTAPAPIQQLAGHMDRAFGPVADGARDLFGIKLTRITGFKGRRTVYADEVAGAPGVSEGGDNFLGTLTGRDAMLAAPGDKKYDDKNMESSVRRAAGGGTTTAASTPAASQQGGSARVSREATPATSLHSSPPGSPARSAAGRRPVAAA